MFICRDNFAIKAAQAQEGPGSSAALAAGPRPKVHINVTAGTSAFSQSSRLVPPLQETLSMPPPMRQRGSSLLEAACSLRAAMQPAAGPLPGYRSMAQFGSVQELMRTK
jgi:hypothetical protein